MVIFPFCCQNLAACSHLHALRCTFKKRCTAGIFSRLNYLIIYQKALFIGFGILQCVF